MALCIFPGVFDLRLDRRQPATSPRSVFGKRLAGRSRIPSPVSSTDNSVPGPQAREASMFLGSMIRPLEESLVVSIGETPVRLSRIRWSDNRSSPMKPARDFTARTFSPSPSPSSANTRVETEPHGRNLEPNASFRVRCRRGRHGFVFSDFLGLQDAEKKSPRAHKTSRLPPPALAHGVVYELTLALASLSALSLFGNELCP